jgi:hypothetical protein
VFFTCCVDEEQEPEFMSGNLTLMEELMTFAKTKPTVGFFDLDPFTEVQGVQIERLAMYRQFRLLGVPLLTGLSIGGGFCLIFYYYTSFPDENITTFKRL